MGEVEEGAPQLSRPRSRRFWSESGDGLRGGDRRWFNGPAGGQVWYPAELMTAFFQKRQEQRQEPAGGAQPAWTRAGGDLFLPIDRRSASTWVFHCCCGHFVFLHFDLVDKHPA